MCAFSLPIFVYVRQVAGRYIQEYRLDCAHKRVKYSILIVICKWNEISTNKNVQFSWNRTILLQYLSQWRFGRVSSVHLQAYNKRITIRDIGNVQYHDQEESKLNSNIMANIAAHALTDDKIIKSPFNKNNAATIENK